MPLGSTTLYDIFWGQKQRSVQESTTRIYNSLQGILRGTKESTEARLGWRCFISVFGYFWAPVSEIYFYWGGLGTMLWPNTVLDLANVSFSKDLKSFGNTRGISYIMTSSSTLLTVNGMCTKTLQNFKLLCKRLSEKFCFATYIFENESTFWNNAILTQVRTQNL